MSLLLPYGLNAALKRRDPPFGAVAGDPAKAGDYAKLERIVQRAEPAARAKAETVGKMIMSGALRAGAGPNGNAALAKRAQERRYPIMHDDPEKARLNKAVGAALAGLRGHSGHPSMGWLAKGAGSPGVGAGVRALKAANDRNLPNLPGVQGPMIDENALEILNSLPDARVRNGVINAVMMRPPANPNDGYRWMQSIVELREQINEMCKEMGLDPTALTDLLDRRVAFYDPTVQTQPATAAPRGSNLGSDPDDPGAWPAELAPPAEPIDPDGPQHRDRRGGYLPGFQHDDFAGATRTDLNPDFAAEEKLAKFWDHAKRGVDIRKGEAGSRDQLERYGVVVVKSEIDGALGKQILAMHDARKRAGPRAWAKVMREPHYTAVLESIATHPRLTRAMKGACVALIM